jgi:hypothetical protein
MAANPMMANPMAANPMAMGAPALAGIAPSPAMQQAALNTAMGAGAPAGLASSAPTLAGAGAMPPGAGGWGNGLGAGPGLAAAGPAGNLAALRAAMMRRRGAVAAPGTGMAGAPMAAPVTAAGPGASLAAAPAVAAAPAFKRGGKVTVPPSRAAAAARRAEERRAAGGELEGDTPRGVLPSNWKARQWGERDRSASNLPPPVERKARGGVVAQRPKGPPKVSIAVGISRRRPAVSTPSPYDFEQDEGTAPGMADGGKVLVPPSRAARRARKAEGRASGGKWIQGAIKRPGALRAKLGVKEGENIPAGKLAKAAKAPGRTGQQARLAQTLRGFHRAKGGACPEESAEKRAKGGLHDRGPGGLFASNQNPLGARGAPEKRRPVTGHYGEKERAETRARGGLLGGGQPLNKRGIRSPNPEERRPVSGRYGQVPGTMKKAKGGWVEGTGGGLHTGTSQAAYQKPVKPPERRAKGGLHDEARGGLHTGTGGDRTPMFKSTSNLVRAKKLSRGPGGPSLSFAAGGAAKERRGFPNTIPPPAPKRLAKGGKVRGTGIAQRGTHFSGIF